MPKRVNPQRKIYKVDDKLSTVSATYTPIKRHVINLNEVISDDDIFHTPLKKQRINEITNIESISEVEVQNSKDLSLGVSDISSISKESDNIEISENTERTDPIIIQQYKDINTTLSVVLNNSVYNHEYQIKAFSTNYIFNLLSKGSPNEKSILLKPHINKRIIIFPIDKHDNEIKLIILNNIDRYYIIEVCNGNNNMCNNICSQLAEYLHLLLYIIISLIKIWTKVDSSLIFCLCNKNVSIFNYYVHIIFKLIDNFGYYYSDKKDLGNYLQVCGKYYHYNMNNVLSFIEQIKRGIIPKLLSNQITYIDPQ